MSYILKLSPKRDLTTSLEPGVVNIAKGGEHTAGQSGNFRFVSSSIFSGLALAAAMAFMNLGSPTTTNQSTFTNSQQSANPYTLRNKKGEDETEVGTDENIIRLSQSLQNHFGFKTAQWAKILKVERKTIYNWKSNTETRVKSDASKRILVLSEFAKAFKGEHALLFAKFVFGSKSNEELTNALHSDSLDLSVLTDAYYKIYTEIDGAVKRKKLLN